MKKLSIFIVLALLLVSVTAVLAAETEDEYELVVKKTAVTSFTRTYTWEIDKSVDIAEWELYEGQSGTSEYTVALTRSVVDSDFLVTGRISFLNPHPTEAAVIESVSDLISPDIVAEVECGRTFPFSLPAGYSFVCTYSANLPDAATRTNTATVTTSGVVKGNFATATVDFSRATKTEVGFPTITVDDSWYGDLGSFSASGLVSYSRTFTCFDDKGEHINTATINETGQSSSAAVMVICKEVEKVCQEETAWAAGSRYVSRGNWATFTPFNGEAKTVTLFAGQTMDAGSVHFSAPVDGKVTITIELNAGWEFQDDPENVKIQDYEFAPSGNPSPGEFDHKGFATGSSFSIEVPLNNFYGVHVDVAFCE
jgi:hypothetical protein